MKELYLLDPTITFLNHGSFGACPKPVFEEYQRWQLALERQPVQFMAVDIYAHLQKARNALGKFIGCDGDDLFFVPNPTTAVNTVIRSLDFGKGDEILSTNHEYGSLIRAWQWVGEEKGFQFKTLDMPLPLSDHIHFVEYFLSGISDQTKAIYLSHITSSTALIFPVQEICRWARKNDILTIIDGAHVPGHLPLNLAEINADIYTGACHKWLSAPKGSTFLYVRKELQHLIKPLVISLGKDVDPSPSPFIFENQYQGTRDPSAFLSVPAAIQFQKEHHWDAISAQCRELTRTTRDRVHEITQTKPLCPNKVEWLGQMASVELKNVNAKALKKSLLDQYRIEIPVFEWNGKTLLRFSFNAYNDEKDAERLIDVLRELF